jgi:hypothetical protein
MRFFINVLLTICSFAILKVDHHVDVDATQNIPVCAFDIDQTLTRQSLASTSSCQVSEFEKESDARLTGAYARNAIAECYAAGFQVAIATAEPLILAKLSAPWLTQLSNNRFNSSFFDTPAFGHGNSNKTHMLLGIQSYFETTPECVILFDDQISNDKTADDLGMLSQEASIACGGHNQFCLSACGLTQSEFESGMSKLKSKCLMK